MYEGVEAGENEQRHHGAERHHVVELGLQHVASVPALQSNICRPIEGGVGGWVLQPACEVLKIKDEGTHIYYNGYQLLHLNWNRCSER